MQIVIDIPEDKYDGTKVMVRSGFADWATNMIANGKPLAEVLDSIKREVVDNDKVMIRETLFVYQAIIPVDEVVDIIDKYKRSK